MTLPPALLATDLSTAALAMNLIVGVTGSVAVVKLDSLIEALQNQFSDIAIVIVATASALKMMDQRQGPPEKTLYGCTLYTEDDEWKKWEKVGDRVLHIELRNWAEAILVAPLDANTLAKISHGLCDNLLTSVMRAWDPSKPAWVCPAMNTFMWDHPFTRAQLEVLQCTLGYNVISPISKRLACNDIGMGAMAETADIARRMHERHTESQPPCGGGVPP